ncbi:MAG: RNA polymerase sigma factor [Roseovarius sp.]
METSDESLARAAAGGDRYAFSLLLERHYDRVFRLAFRLTGAAAEAEDLTQDVCAALPSRLQGFRGEARFGTWLWRVVVNAAHDRRRKAATRARHSEGWGDWEVNRRAVATEAAEAVDWLTQAMRALPEELRDTLALVLDDLSHEEAAEVLGVAPGTVSWRISEAKKRLRAQREKEDQA